MDPTPAPIDAVFAIPELLACILGYLDLRDVPSVRRTCHAWNAAQFIVQCQPGEDTRVWERARQLIEAGDLSGLKAVLELVARTAIPRALLELLFTNACAHGHIAIAVWLADRYKTTPDEARCTFNAPLRSASEYGHTEIVQWLAGRFGLTAEDARSGRNYALRWACTNGHIATVQCLVDRFGLTRDDAHYKVFASNSLSDEVHAVDLARASGHEHIVRWLADRFR